MSAYRPDKGDRYIPTSTRFRAAYQNSKKQMGSSEGIISIGKWGGPGGEPWSFKASRGITGIIVNECVNIKSISFKDASGFISGKFGGSDPNLLDVEKKVEIRWPSEYLKSISGTYGVYHGMSAIMSLSFTTNLTTYGPFGTTKSGEAFSLPMADCVIVGFHGRSSNVLDALGIFVQPDESLGSISFGPWGGPGGDPFSFRVGSSIKKIIVHVGTNIKSIAFKDAQGNDYGKFGGKSPNDTGEEKTIEIDGNSEYLMSITGTHGNFVGLAVITSLSFITNINTHGPFGTASGTSFSIPMQGSLVNGFHGRGGYYLDAIGIQVKPKDDIKGAISIGPWGGQGGDPWSYITNRGINQIIIHVGKSNVKSISFQDTTGQNSGKFGGKHPSDTGERKIVNINWPSEHLISISGTYGDFISLLTITSLSFTTNLATYGPYGKTSGTSFSITLSNNMVAGFHGRAGYYLDAIGIFVKPETTF